MDNKLSKTISKITTAIEHQVDDALDQLDNLTVTDFAELRQARLKAMKDAVAQKQKWMEQGHGVYTELPDEKSFFDVSKHSEIVIFHFYQDNSMPCKILDMHLRDLAAKHIEARFVSLNAPKCPFLCSRLQINIMPTILIIVQRMTVDRIVGFTELGNTNEFSTKLLEWRLAQKSGIDYDGDLSEPPLKKASKTKFTIIPKRSIREKESDSDGELSD